MPTTTLNRSEEHTSELQSLRHLVCRLLLEKQRIEIFEHGNLGRADKGPAACSTTRAPRAEWGDPPGLGRAAKVKAYCTNSSPFFLRGPAPPPHPLPAPHGRPPP